MTSSKKVAIIGAGYVGSTIAYTLLIRGLAEEIVLIEREDRSKKCFAEIMDIRHGIPYMGSSNIYAGTYEDIKNCELIILTAGRNRLPNESRLDLAKDNIEIVKKIQNGIEKHYNGGVLLVVTNPVDVLTQKLTEWFGLANGTIFGTGCMLDSSRLTNIIADFVKLRPDIVTASIIGEHGNKQITLWSKIMVAGMPINDYCKMSNLILDDNKKRAIEKEVIQMGKNIIEGKGRTHYGIATCVCYIADSVLNRRSTILNVTSTLHGEYGFSGVALSLPSVVSAYGIERKIIDKLSDYEVSQLKDTVETLKKSSE